MKHVAADRLAARAARIVSTTPSRDRSAGVLYVLTGEEFCAHTDFARVAWMRPRDALRRCERSGALRRRMGGGRRRRFARARRGRGVNWSKSNTRRWPHVIESEEALKPGAPLVHPAHGSNVLYHRSSYGGRSMRPFATPGTRSRPRGLGRSATVPIETFRRRRAVGPRERGSSTSGLRSKMPKFPDRRARALRLPATRCACNYDVDVGGSYGVKRGLKHAVLVGYLAKKLGVPVR